MKLRNLLLVVRWAWCWILASAGIDIGLGLYAMLNTTLHDALNTELIDGYRIGIVCGYLGLVCNGLAIPLLLVVLVSGLMRTTELELPACVGDQLRLSFYPVVLTRAEAAALRGDKEVLHYLNHPVFEAHKESLIKKTERSGYDIPIGFLREDPYDVYDLSAWPYNPSARPSAA